MGLFFKRRTLHLASTTDYKATPLPVVEEDVCYAKRSGKFGRLALVVFNYQFLVDENEDLARCAYEISSQDGTPEVLVRKWKSLTHDDILNAVKIFVARNEKIRPWTRVYLDGEYLGDKFENLLLKEVNIK